MNTFQAALFVALVFGVVVFLSLAVILPTVGTGAQANRKMKRRIRLLLNSPEQNSAALIRESSRFQQGQIDTGDVHRTLIGKLDLLIRQAGSNLTVNRFFIQSLLFALVVFVLALAILPNSLIALCAALAAALVPYFRLRMQRQKRLDRFEEQMAEALDVMSRALKAGHPFNETLNFVAEEMDEPIGPEFGRLFSDINYGMPSKTAFYALMKRVPSVSLHTLITAVLIQQESGGALAEILEKVAEVIRGRFRLQRRIKTLSAEGRMSAWVLSLLPFVLAGMLTVVSPDYLPVLFNDPAGQKLIAVAIGLMLAGILWMRHIIRIKV